MFTVNPAPKPTYKRSKPTQKQRGNITTRVSKEVLRRSNGACERCGRTTAYAFERAHIENRSQLGRGDVPWNIALLCGPSVNTGTCHHWIDNTKEGKRWAREFSKRLKEQYREDEWI